jgi:hypothetical protein
MAELKLVDQDVNNTTPVINGPLTSLEAIFAPKITRYPQDLAPFNTSGKNSKNHWVTFTIKDVVPAKIGSESPRTTITTDPNATAALTTGLVGVNFAKNLFSNSKTAGAIADTAQQASANLLISNLTKNGLKVSPPLNKIESIISLYMPDTLTASYSANYEEMSLTSDLGPLITTLRAIGSSGESVQKFLNGGGGNDISTDPNVVQAALGAANIAGIDLPGIDLANLVTVLQQGQGYALNPQLQMVYRGTGLRTFSLSFTMTPKSQPEAQAVNNIIQQFRFYSSPSLGQTNKDITQSTTDSMFLIPPSVFNLQFFVNGKESAVLPKYGDCILTDVEVNHAPNGFASFTDGSMVQTQLNLSFKELNILTRDNINDTVNPRR